MTPWNDDRGFGFIEAAQTRERLFVHVSAFERGRVRPPLGTRLTFAVERDARGRRRAVDVVMPGDTLAARAPVRSVRPPRVARRRSPAWALLAVVCVAAAVVVRSPQPASTMEAPAQRFGCVGRTYCSQMHSCEEATWMSNHCPGTMMDGNHDGVPCERQWCTGAH